MHTFGGVCDGYDLCVSDCPVGEALEDLQISTAPAVAPARMERIALGCQCQYENLSALSVISGVFTFFFSVGAAAILELLHLELVGVAELESCA